MSASHSGIITDGPFAIGRLAFIIAAYAA